MSLTKQDLQSVEGIVTTIVTQVVTQEVDSLAAITAKGFEDVDKRFEQVDRRFEDVDKRFEQVDRRFEDVDTRFESMDKRFESMDKRFESMDKRFDRIDDKLDYVNDASKQRDRELADKIDGVAKMLSGDMEPVYADIKNLKYRVGKLEKVSV